MVNLNAALTYVFSLMMFMAGANKVTDSIAPPVHADLLAQFTVFAKSPWGFLRLSPTLFMYVVGYLELTCAFAIVHAQRNGGNKKLPVFVLFCVLYCAVMTHAWHQDGKHWPAFILAMVAAFILTEDTSGGKAVKAAREATATATANETKKSK